MTDDVLLDHGGSMPETDAEREAVTQAWTSWLGSLGGALKDGGNPFSGQAKSPSSDGSIGEEVPAVIGYSIIQADSLDAAVDLAKGCPQLQEDGSISVHETFAVM